MSFPSRPTGSNGIEGVGEGEVVVGMETETEDKVSEVTNVVLIVGTGVGMMSTVKDMLSSIVIVVEGSIDDVGIESAGEEEGDGGREESEGGREESDGGREESDGGREESDGGREESDGGREESDGGREEGDGGREESDGGKEESDGGREEGDGEKEEGDDDITLVMGTGRDTGPVGGAEDVPSSSAGVENSGISSIISLLDTAMDSISSVKSRSADEKISTIDSEGDGVPDSEVKRGVVMGPIVVTPVPCL